MTNELNRLEGQLRLTLNGESWHGPSLLKVLADVSAEQASCHPIPDAHSIWELVLHIGSDYTLILRRLAGDGRPFTPEEDWPTCPPATAENWRQTVEALSCLNDQLREAVLAFPADRLDEPLVHGVPYSAYTQFIGVTQHNLYHAGQISLLKRLLATQDRASSHVG